MQPEIIDPGTDTPPRRGGRRTGSRNAIDPARIRAQASRRVPEALDALADIVARPDQPNAQARALAASTIVQAAMAHTQP